MTTSPRTNFRNAKRTEYVTDSSGRTVGWIQHRPIKNNFAAYLISDARTPYMIGDAGTLRSVLNAIGEEN